MSIETGRDWDDLLQLLRKQIELLEDVAEGLWLLCNVIPWEEEGAQKFPWTRPSKREKEGE